MIVFARTERGAEITRSGMHVQQAVIRGSSCSSGAMSPSTSKAAWISPEDPSGIARCRVRLQVTSKVNPTDQDWSDVKIKDPVTTTQVNADNETTCGGYYRWRIVAYDGAGNQGNVSAWVLFQIAMP